LPSLEDDNCAPYDTQTTSSAWHATPYRNRMIVRLNPRRIVVAAMMMLPAAHTNIQSQAWTPDAGAGRYRNPISFADYSDPDAIRVGDDFYMTASSFGHLPALPILHSRDLVHWRLINHAIQRLGADFDVPQHGNGVWAPAIRFHNGAYYATPGTTSSLPPGAWHRMADRTGQCRASYSRSCPLPPSWR
jgi:Glycosyl hydrolases family 43